MFYFQLKIRGTSEKFKNQPRPLLRPRSVNFRQHIRNLSRKTVPLNDVCSNVVKMCTFFCFSLHLAKSKLLLYKNSTVNFVVRYFVKGSKQCCVRGSVTFCYGSGSADPCRWPMDPDLVPDIFVLVFKTPAKKCFIKSFSAFYFLKAPLHHFLR